MRQHYDIASAERVMRDQIAPVFEKALLTAQSDDERRSLVAQRDLIEAQIIQMRVALQLINEGFERAVVARILGLHCAHAFHFMAHGAGDPGSVASAFMAGLFRNVPGAPVTMAEMAIHPMQGGTA